MAKKCSSIQQLCLFPIHWYVIELFMMVEIFAVHPFATWENANYILRYVFLCKFLNKYAKENVRKDVSPKKNGQFCNT